MGHLWLPVRPAALCLGLSGLAVAAGTPWHPSIFERPVDDVVRHFGAWQLLHLLAVAVVVLAVVGAAGVVAAHDDDLGRLGLTALLVTLVGSVSTAVLVGLEAVTFPVLADRDPRLLDLGGPLLGLPVLLGAGVVALGWPVGLALLGAAAARSRRFGRWPGVVLAVSAILFVALAGPFVPVAGALAAVLFGGAQLWWAWLMWQDSGAGRPGARTPTPAPVRTPSP
ncbi:MAG TPA: hypothetical protein VFJ94_13825 [Intrasporangium sp.]|uniref:hypothetical protein n=1 Tax=Intrasporangium sp. TaxID=1925024 RepID=UPI002D792AA1|nr:hypothetical protein [Intrasporangium sp.]HET7399591.1 hypothetical protein [Intrasporangium sp.]